MQNSSINVNSQCRIESKEIRYIVLTDFGVFLCVFFLNGLIMCRKLFCLGEKALEDFTTQR